MILKYRDSGKASRRNPKVIACRATARHPVTYPPRSVGSEQTARKHIVAHVRQIRHQPVRHDQISFRPIEDFATKFCDNGSGNDLPPAITNGKSRIAVPRCQIEDTRRFGIDLNVN
jgi:hypothetical protein